MGMLRRGRLVQPYLRGAVPPARAARAHRRRKDEEEGGVLTCGDG